MDMYEAWEKALSQTEIIRSRVQSLKTFEDTTVPYIFLAESAVNPGDTVARMGTVVVEKPSLILPPNVPQFEGFEFDEKVNFDQNSLMTFLLIRGINVPSFRYNNKTSSLTLYEGDLSRAIDSYLTQLQRQEDVHTGLLTGPEDCWQFSIFVYICAQIARNAENDIQRLLAEYRKRQN